MSAKPEGEVGCDREEVGEWETFDWISNTDKVISSIYSEADLTYQRDPG